MAISTPTSYLDEEEEKKLDVSNVDSATVCMEDLSLILLYCICLCRLKNWESTPGPQRRRQCWEEMGLRYTQSCKLLDDQRLITFLESHRATQQNQCVLAALDQVRQLVHLTQYCLLWLAVAVLDLPQFCLPKSLNGKCQELKLGPSACKACCFITGVFLFLPLVHSALLLIREP